MAEKTAAELAKELEALQAKNIELQEEAIALRQKSKPGDNTGVAIPGTFSTEMETPSGEKKVLKLKFQAGCIYCRLKGGEKVSSASLMKLANGKTLTKDELASNPALEALGKDGAAEWLTHLARINVAFLVEA